MIKNLIWALLIGMIQAYPVYAAEADSLPQYNVDYNASEMLNDAAVRSLLKSTLAQGEQKEVDYFNADKFTIKITTVCENNSQCNDATYYGKRIKDGAELTLKGKAERALCDASPCPPLTFKFRNGNVDYILSKIDNSLTVIENNKIILAEKGAWYKQNDNPSSFSGK